MWETVLSIMAAACCLRRKKPKTRQRSPNPDAEVVREDLEEETEEAVDTAESDETEEEEENTSGETAIQAFETAPDKLFNYDLNRLPPELESLYPSDFLEQPDQMNITLLPKHILARICEMLPPNDFERLSQTCRLMHWKMIKWCQCYMKELNAEVRDAGRKSNGDVRVVMYPEMANSIYMKHIVFERVNLHIKIPHYGSPFMQKLIQMFKLKTNYKTLEVFINHLDHKDIRHSRDFFIQTRASRFHLTCLKGFPDIMCYHVLHSTIPQVCEMTCRSTQPLLRCIIYTEFVPIEVIARLARHFLDDRSCPIKEYHLCFNLPDRDDLIQSIELIKKWASEQKGMQCLLYDYKEEKLSRRVPQLNYIFRYPGEPQKVIGVFVDQIWLVKY